MAMRDPGTPGRNPFFDHGPDHGPDPVADDGTFDGPAAERPSGTGDPDGDFWEQEFPWNDTAERDPLARDPLGTLANLVDALQAVQPEATEHLVTAAHELMLAVKCVVDATEAVLAAQRAAAAAATPPAAPGRDPLLRDDVESTREPEAPTSRGGVRRIDLS
jgi:hypothetical protein